MRRHRDTFLSNEAGMRCEGDYHFWWRGYKITVTNVAFVATNKVILAASVYPLV
jgi:hypothetical protein